MHFGIWLANQSRPTLHEFGAHVSAEDGQHIVCILGLWVAPHVLALLALQCRPTLYEIVTLIERTSEKQIVGILDAGLPGRRT